MPDENPPAATQNTNGPYSPAGKTANFQFLYQTSLGTTGSAIAGGLKAQCEQSLNTIKGWFGVTPPNLPFKVFIESGINGAKHNGCADTEIYVGAITGTAAASNVYSLLLAAEVVEVHEAAVGLDWNCGYSNGEALSRVLAADIFPGAQTLSMMSAPVWLYNNAPDGTLRRNWIDHTEVTDANNFAIGCSVLFLNWLRFGLGHSWSSIIHNGDVTLGGLYQKLIGQNNGWQQFKALVDTRFSPNKPHVKSDNPFQTGEA